jgi:D-amino peptidase
MNIYVMVDAEGLSGIHLREQVMSDGKFFSEFRKYMTQEINACVEGLKSGGAEKIIVRDAHASGSNVIWHELSPIADEYVIGNSGTVRMPGIEEYDAVVLLGYHAMAGTQGAVLEHTMSSQHWQNFWINGKRSGEIAFDAAVAGNYNKPVIMVSGDDKTCTEAADLIPNVVTAQVKKAISLYGARHLPLEKAYTLIREKSALAVKKAIADEIKPYTVQMPVTLRLEVTERGDIPGADSKPYMKIIDGHTYEVIGNTMEEAFARL